MNSPTPNSNQTGLGFIIYVISGETKEIIQYQILHFDSTFEEVIDNLKKLGKPSNLFYYNGDTTQISQTDKVSSYLPTRRNQVIFWASSGQLEFPVVQHKKNNILVLMITPDYQMLSFDAPGSTDINQLTSNYGPLVKLANGNQTKITSGTLSENLPIRSKQIVFLLELNLDKKIDLVNDYTLGKILGKGGFGTVYFARDHKKGFGNVAIKLIPSYDKVTNISNKLALNSELISWKQISKYPKCNKYIVCLYDFGTGTLNGEQYFVLIMEYIGNSMELYDFSKKFKMTFPVVDRILNDLVIGLREMHKQGVYHKDIKNQNILISLSDDNSDIAHVKYIDFGISCIFGENKNKKCDMRSGTPTYMSAELIHKNYASSFTERELKAIDIYALGVTMYEMFNKHPYFDAAWRAQKQNDDTILFNALKLDYVEPLLTADIEGGWLDAIKRYNLATTITSLVNPNMKQRLDAFDAIKTQDMLSSSSSSSSSSTMPPPKVIKLILKPLNKVIIPDYEQNSQKRLSSKPSSKPSSWVMMPDYTQNQQKRLSSKPSSRVIPYYYDKLDLSTNYSFTPVLSSSSESLVWEETT